MSHEKKKIYWLNTLKKSIQLIKGDVMNEWFLDEIVKLHHKTSTQLKQPKKYKVILLNDDYTPMEFVVEILKQIFHFNELTAIKIMLQVHIIGKALCGVFTRDIAETKVILVNHRAKACQYPLLCIMEPE